MRVRDEYRARRDAAVAERKPVIAAGQAAPSVRLTLPVWPRKLAPERSK
jgi:hypothetical protein